MDVTSAWRVCKGVNFCGHTLSAGTSFVEDAAELLSKNESPEASAARKALDEALEHLWTGIGEVRELQPSLEQCWRTCSHHHSGSLAPEAGTDRACQIQRYERHTYRSLFEG